MRLKSRLDKLESRSAAENLPKISGIALLELKSLDAPANDDKVIGYRSGTMRALREPGESIDHCLDRCKRLVDWGGSKRIKIIGFYEIYTEEGCQSTSKICRA